MNTLLKYKFWIGGAVGLLAIGLIIGAARPKHVSGAPGASAEVEVVQIEQKDVPIFGEWIGTLDGFTNADVRAQVTGYLQRQGYQEGAFVRKGQLLFEIDPRPFQAAFDQAEGQLAQAKAALANAQAVQGRTELDVNRYTPLAKEQAASQQDLDNAIQNNLAAKATVATANAQIRTAEAAVETARINLDFTRLIAPIDGIAGQAQLQVGALVNPSSGPIRIAALFPNPGNILRPGGYGRVRTAVRVQKGALLVPQRAVLELQGSYQVAVVDGENKVSVRTVQVGDRVGTQWIVAEGLKQGERVVVEGVQKVRPGMQVNPKPFAAETKER